MNQPLPIVSLKPRIIESLAESNTLILQAPAGSGKSTLLPQYLLDHVIDSSQSVWVLQPRRIAARMLARFVAQLRGGTLGGEIGYQVKLDRQSSKATRLMFVTEGILMKRLLAGDRLPELGAVVLDEFHERHSETDVTLALALQLQLNHRPDLKIVVMSATLNTNTLRKYLPLAPVIETDGRLYPVDTHYTTINRNEDVWDAAATQLEANRSLFSQGAALVFMPGAYEIRRTVEAIGRKKALAQFQVCQLHGSLSKAEQDEAIKEGKGKIIVSTNVAETSLTIPGVTLVIDSGLVRIARFDARREMDTLHTSFVSHSSAGQRAGRAGRTTAGTCIRLWSEFHHQHLPPFDTPEIHRIDISSIILGLINHPETDIESFNWIEPPKPESISSALALLRHLGAITTDNVITKTGRLMARLPVHPRNARLLVDSYDSGCEHLGALTAALSESPAIFSASADAVVSMERMHRLSGSHSDLLIGVNGLIFAISYNFNPIECKLIGINHVMAQQVVKSAEQLIRAIGSDRGLPASRPTPEEEKLMRRCIFNAFFDRLAIRADFKTAVCNMTGNRTGRLSNSSMVQDARLMVATNFEESRTGSGTILMLKQVTEVELDWITDLQPTGFSFNHTITFDKRLAKVVKITEVKMNDLVFERRFSDETDNDEAANILADCVLNGDIAFEAWDEKADQFVNRVNFASARAPHYSIPTIDQEARQFILQQCFNGCRSVKDLQRAKLWPALHGYLNNFQLAAVDAVAPETIRLPHKNRQARLRYDDKKNVILSETIQAFYDCPTPVTVAEGTVEVLYELLSPARRPVQLTGSLDNFWTGSYPEIRKELKGRYPKHEWR